MEKQLPLFAATDLPIVTKASDHSSESRHIALPVVDGIVIDLSGQGSNTALEYMYRDGCNFKQFRSSVLSGRITRAGVLKILSNLFNYNSFIPSQVGLPDLQGLFGTPWTEDDLAMHELQAIKYTSEPVTEDEMQNGVAAATVVDRWPTKGEDGWDIDTAEMTMIERIGYKEPDSEDDDQRDSR